MDKILHRLSRIDSNVSTVNCTHASALNTAHQPRKLHSVTHLNKNDHVHKQMYEDTLNENGNTEITVNENEKR